MRELNKQEMHVISRIVKRRLALVNKKVSVWRFLHEEFNVGISEGVKYRLTQDDYRKLRTCVEAISGIDPLKYNEQAVTKDRITVSRGDSNGSEKYAKQSPTYRRINIVTHSGHITLKKGESKLPPGTSLDICYDDIPVPDVVIVCENLEVFNQWCGVNLSKKLRNTITCYRGHDKKAKYLNNWLESIQNSCKIIVFPDFDPSGIMNALLY